jgi:hypothetical protein
VAFGATYDACVLHPAGLRDLLVRLATTGMFRAHWSTDILDEMVRSILRRRPDLTAAQLDRTRELMCNAVPDCLTTGYEELIDGLHLPDPDDRHVLARGQVVAAAQHARRGRWNVGQGEAHGTNRLTGGAAAGPDRRSHRPRGREVP